MNELRRLSKELLIGKMQEKTLTYSDIENVANEIYYENQDALMDLIDEQDDFWISGCQCIECVEADECAYLYELILEIFASDEIKVEGKII